MFHFKNTGYAAILALFVLFSHLAIGWAEDSEVDRKVAGWLKYLNAIEKTLKHVDIKDETIAKVRTDLAGLKVDAHKVLDGEVPKLAALKEQMEKLGPEPKDMSEEVAKVRATQKTLLDKQQSLNDSINLALVKASQLDDIASEIQRGHFLNRLLDRAGTPLNPSLWLKAGKNLSNLPSRVAFLFSGWAADKAAMPSGGRYLIIFLALILAFFITFPLRGWLRVRIRPEPDEQKPDDVRRINATVKAGLADILLPIIAIVIFYTVLKITGLLTLRLDSLVIILMAAIAWTMAIRGIARAILSPDVPHWRLGNLADASAKHMYKLITLIAYVFGFHIFFSRLTSLLFLPLPIAITSTALTSVLIAGLLAAILRVPIAPNEAPNRQAQSDSYFTWVMRLRKPLWLFVGAIIISTLLGYIALGHFLAVQLVRTSLLIAALYAFHLLADEMLYPVSKISSEGDQDSDQNALGTYGPAFAVLIDFLLVLIALPIILLQWGVSQEDLRSWISAAFFGFEFGNVKISLSSILIAFVVLFIGIIITNLLQRWLDVRLLSKTRLDVGVRNSLRTGLIYSGYLLSLIIAISYGGVDFTDIAIVAGALSVGIGFGLQSIINNFVSGLILLAERPFKAGDWIVVGNEEGYVKQIKVRSTEVMTFNRATLTVPNSELITKTVKNWTHKGTLGRVIVDIGVSYDADPEQVRDILLKCASQHKEVRKKPEPSVVFSNFGDSALEFQLRAFIVDVDRRLGVGSDLRFAIFRDLKAAGIEIPFPQRDIHIKQGDISS